MAKKLERKYPLKTSTRTSASDALKETLELYNVSQKEFAKRINVSPAYLSYILTRKKYMSRDIALRIEKVTGMSAKLLLRLDFQYKLEQMNKEAESLNDLEAYDWAKQVSC